jgi:hypothetical protein
MNWWDSRYLENLIAAEVLDGNGPTIEDPFVGLISRTARGGGWGCDKRGEAVGRAHG